MSKILVNYNYNKKKDKYTILDNEFVFAELPIAVVESEDVIFEPFLINDNGVKILVDKINYTSNHILFKLALDKDGKLVEDVNGVDFWAPLGTKFEDLEYNGQGQVVINKKDEIKSKNEKPNEKRS